MLVARATATRSVMTADADNRNGGKFCSGLFWGHPFDLLVCVG